MDAPASRNAPCPCGSGRRYKHCHGAAGADHATPAAVPPPVTPLDEMRTLVAQRRFAEAIAAAEARIAANGETLDLLRIVGEAQVLAGDAAAEATWRRVLARAPEDAEALFHLGNLARAAGDAERAIDHLARATRAAPAHTGILNNLGLALEAADRLGDAATRFREALALAPEAFEPRANLAQNLFRQHRHGDALAEFDRLVSRFDLATPAVWANRGVCQRLVGDLEGAAASFERALAGEASSSTLQLEYGLVNVELKRFDVAARAFERCLALAPDGAQALAALLFCRQNLAEWSDFEALRARVVARARAIDGHGNDPISPFDFLSICDDPALSLAVAREWTRIKVPMPDRAPPSPPSPAATGARLRLGFVSFDLYDHPVGRLVVGLIERLDRARFHVTLYALGPARDDAIRQRLVAAADAFVATERLDVAALSRAIREASVDVLVDLGGYTGNAPVKLFAARPAPVQVGFLGYTGTMGSAAYDFIVADRHCIPAASAQHYAETPLYVEPCYLPSDTRRTTGAAPDRSAYALPHDAIVLCSFANTYKILPGLFDAWMTLLRRHPRAVLWLRDAGEAVDARLCGEARARGVDGARLVFAPVEPSPRYLARFRLADLYLDTAPYGSHTTLNDALFSGLPAVALDGRTFAARASASQLLAAGLGELVATTLDGYVAIADRLIADPDALRAVTGRLRASAGRSPLFDSDGYARAFERAMLRAVAAKAADGSAR